MYRDEPKTVAVAPFLQAVKHYDAHLQYKYTNLFITLPNANAFIWLQIPLLCATERTEDFVR